MDSFNFAYIISVHFIINIYNIFISVIFRNSLYFKGCGSVLKLRLIWPG